jgi:hypothetical protein
MKLRVSPLLLLTLPLTLLLAAALPLALVGADDAPHKVVIVGVTGDWYMKVPSEHDYRSAAKKANDPYVHFLDTFGVDQSTCAYGTDGSIVVEFNGKAYSFPCEKSAAQDNSSCQPPYPLPLRSNKKPFACGKLIVPPSTWENIKLGLASIVPLLTNSAERFVTPVSRGLESELDDAVVLQQNGIINFAPVLHDMDAGNYSLRIESLGAPQISPHNVSIKWNGGNSAVADISALAPGLYRVSRLQTAGTAEGTDAWILVSDATHFKNDSENFQASAEATKNWPPDADARAPRAILRAYLEALSKHSGEGQ